MTDLSELHEPFVEWVFDHSDDAPAGHVDFREFSEAHGLDLEASFELLRQSKDLGFMANSLSTMGTPMAVISGYGREWIKARRRRRGDKVQRMIAARNGLLRWLWEMKQEGRGFPIVKDFLKSTEARFEGDLLTEEEVDQAAASLVKRGLIHGMKSHGRRGPVRAETTDEGDRCVEQYLGDVMAYEQAKHKGGTRISFGGDNKGAFAVDSQHFEQNVTVIEADTAAKVMGVVEQYRQAKPTISLPAAVEAEVVETMEELEREVTSNSPDVGRIRRGLQRVGEHLNTAAAGALGNLIAAGALELAAQLS